ESSAAQLTSLDQEKCRLMEMGLQINQQMSDKDVGNYAGRPFEHKFRQLFIQALYHNGKGLVVSTEYYSNELVKIMLRENQQHFESPTPPFRRKISDNEMNEESSPNRNIDVEITSNRANLVKKMMKIERDLL
ncbi:hypothetical protein MP638_002838, partial [Amoeboaphelidium occidentale]